jgi:hypothetical protein
MASAFDTALTSAQTTALGYIDDIVPLVGAVAVAWLGVKFLRRGINKV